jgi:hypothetical protein
MVVMVLDHRIMPHTGHCPGSLCPRIRRPSRPAHDLRLGVGIHETTFRVNVRWVTPLGEETASTS